MCACYSLFTQGNQHTREYTMIIELTTMDLAIAASLITVGAGATLYGICQSINYISDRLPAAISAWRAAGSETEAWKL